MFAAVCELGLEGIVSKKLTAPYRSGPSKTWIKVKKPNSAAGTPAMDGTFQSSGRKDKLASSIAKKSP
jgi:ATP-dependent DNA ligase